MKESVFHLGYCYYYTLFSFIPIPFKSAFTSSDSKRPLTLVNTTYTSHKMAPSASKQKRLAEKAAKKSASGTATPASTVNGGSTPLTSLSNTGSTEDLVDAAEQMKKLNLATDRSAVSYNLRGCEGEGFASESEVGIWNNTDSQNGVLVSDPKSRDIKIDQYILSFHGRLLIEGAEIALNYGQR